MRLKKRKTGLDAIQSVSRCGFRPQILASAPGCDGQLPNIIFLFFNRLKIIGVGHSCPSHPSLLSLRALSIILKGPIIKAALKPHFETDCIASTILPMAMG